MTYNIFPQIKTQISQQSRIMRDLSKPRSEGLCWSKGFGFVSFTDHQHALAAAKATNNVPVFGGEKVLSNVKQFGEK